MDWTTVLLLGLAVAAGAFVQSSISFGMAVVAAPFVVLAEPGLMPGALLIPSLTLPTIQLAALPRDIDWRTLAWALPARAVATPLGVAIVALVSTRAIAATVGVLVLATVAASVWSPRVRPTRAAAAAAGAIGGVAGTAATIGGPFLALVLQHSPPVRLRSTMATFFVAGSTMAVTGLVLGGQFTREQLLAGLTWLPFVVLGLVAGAPARARLDQARLRWFVLVFCTLASVTVIARSLL